MLYPLSSVHKLIYEEIHPEAISQTADVHYFHDTWRQLKQEIEQSRLHLFSQLSQANGSDCLKVIVYTCQAGYISLINRLGCYIHQAKSYLNAETEPPILFQYREARRLLIVHLNELYRYYFPFFDSEQTVPKFILKSKQHNIRNKILHIRKQLIPLCPDASLLSIVCLPIERMADYEQAKLSYKQFYYINLFLTELSAYCSTATASAESSTFTDFLIRANFNEPQFIEYVIQHLRKQITDDMSLHEQAEKWAFHVKEFNQITTAISYSLYPQRKAVKECLIYAAEQELLFIKQRISLLVSTPATMPLPAQKERISIATHLTVSQLGVFTRLLVDCNVIQHENQTELLKLIAGCLTTTKTAQISAESLRVRYYNPDKASITITKEYLLQMLKQLTQY